MDIVNRKTGEKLKTEGAWEAIRLSWRDGLTLISMTLSPGEAVTPHAVEDRFYLYVVKGAVLFQAGEESHILKPGDLAVDEPGSLHGIVNRGDEEALLLLMRQSLS